MRYALLALALAPAAQAAAPQAPAASVCYYNHRERVVETQTMRCVDGFEAKFDIANNFRFECGVRNAFNLFGALCERPCHSAAKGVGRYALHGKTVVYGPALLPTSPGSKWAFGLFDGSCRQLAERIRSRQSSNIEQLTDDALIKAAELAPPAR